VPAYQPDLRRAWRMNRRYSYYVSRAQLNGKPHSIECGWRVPAPEIERRVAGAACQILRDQAEIGSAVQAIGSADIRSHPSLRWPNNG
jgi:hypothetical protein